MPELPTAVDDRPAAAPSEPADHPDQPVQPDHPRRPGRPGRPAHPAALRRALDEAARIVGEERVLRPAPGADPAGLLGPNTSLFRSRRVAAVLRPADAEQASRLVALFGRDADAGSLHVISTGRNWGLGSREPAQDDAVVLDLGGLDRVRDLDLAAGWAIVEPGVTQGRLSQLLAGTERLVNVTVSAAETSVIGNALDRGVGLRGQRTDDLAGLEVVLPDGESVRVGWWPAADRRAPVYPHGLGPSTLPLFTQSNLGAVTAAVIRLRPRPEALRVVRLSLPRPALAQAVDAVRRWVAQGLTSGVPRIYDPAAGLAYGGAEDEFLVHLPVDGTAESVRALVGVLTAEARRSGLFTGISDSDATDQDNPHREASALVERAYAGDPDITDTLFRAKMGVGADEVDEQAGFLFFLPLLPLNGEAVTHTDRLLREVREAAGTRLSATLHLLSADLVDCVVAMRFPRDEDAARRAHHALDLLYDSFAAAGYAPYRLDVDHTQWRDTFAPDAGAVALTRRLKALLDPHDAFAPGRYH